MRIEALRVVFLETTLGSDRYEFYRSEYNPRRPGECMVNSIDFSWRTENGSDFPPLVYPQRNERIFVFAT
jgi:hypothetical protein